MSYCLLHSQPWHKYQHVAWKLRALPLYYSLGFHAATVLIDSRWSARHLPNMLSPTLSNMSSWMEVDHVNTSPVHQLKHAAQEMPQTFQSQWVPNCFWVAQPMPRTQLKMVIDRFFIPSEIKLEKQEELSKWLKFMYITEFLAISPYWPCLTDLW